MLKMELINDYEPEEIDGDGSASDCENERV